MTKHQTQNFQKLFKGLDIEIPLVNGRNKKYVNFDNAALTPDLKTVQ